MLWGWVEVKKICLQLRNAQLQLLLQRALGSLGQGMGEGIMFKRCTNVSHAKLIPKLSFLVASPLTWEIRLVGYKSLFWFHIGDVVHLYRKSTQHRVGHRPCPILCLEGNK